MGVAFVLAACGLLGSAARADFRAEFDRHDANFNGGLGYSLDDNLQGTLGWGESYLMMGYMALYRGSGEVEYLRKLVQHADNVLLQRDDNAGREDYRGISGPTWVATKYSTDGSPYAWVVHSGMITYPMADFVELVLRDASLWHELAYDGRELIQVAQSLAGEVAATIAAHDDQWDAAIGVYRGRDVPFTGLGGAVLPYNQYAAMGRTLIKMYYATGNLAYANKVDAMASHFKAVLRLQSNGSYTWPYRGTTGNEDISHAAIELDFARLCYERGRVFNATDMLRFARTFTRNVYRGPLDLANYVHGGDRSLAPGAYAVQAGRWTWVSTFEPDAYHEISDVLLAHAFAADPPSTSILYGLSLLHLYQRALDPFMAHRGSGSASQWAAVAAGDFDRDGVDELAAVRNFDGNFYFYDVAGHGVQGIGSYQGFGAASQWAGVAAGDFDGDGDQELAAVRNYDGNFYLVDYNGGAPTAQTIYTAATAASAWAGIAAGDFDGDQRDEIAAVRNIDGNLYVLEPVAGSWQVTASYTGFGSASQWVGVAAGDFDGDTRDEIVAVRNYDGNFHMFELAFGELRVVASNTSPGAASQWLGITAGDFDGDGRDEFVATRDFDGDAYFYQLSGNQIVSMDRDYFPTGLQHGILGAGRLRSTAQDRDDLIIIRGADADFFAYRVRDDYLAW